MGRRRTVGAMALAMAVLVGCGGGDGGGTGDGPRPGAPAGRSIVAVLDLLPDTFVEEFGPGEQGGTAQVAHLVRAAEAVEVEELSPGADAAERGEYLNTLAIDAGLVFPELLEAVEGLDQELGIDVADLTATARWESAEGTLEVLIGGFDADAIEDAVDDDEVWGDLLEVREYAGFEYYSWGDGEAVDPALVTDVRPLGRAAHLFVDDDRGVAYWASSIEVMESALDTFAGDEPSLADSDRYGPLGEVMDEVGAHAVLVSPSFGLDREAALGPGAEPGEEWEGPALLPWEAVAGGATLIDGELRAVLAYVAESVEDAGENVARLEEVLAGNSALTNAPWTGEPGAVVVESDDNLTIATFPTEQPRLPVDAYYRRDSLYFTE